MAIQSEEVNILFNADTAKAVASTNNLNKSIKDQETQVNGLSDSYKKLTGVISAFASLGLAKVFTQFTEKALQFQEQSDALTNKFGINTKQLLKDLTEASGGQISQFDLLAASSRAMALGVTTDSQTLVTLMNFATSKSDELGKSAKEVFDGLIEGLGKGSAKVLTTVGIQKEAFDKLGISLDGTTSKQALLNVVTAEATEYNKKFVPTLESGADRLDKLRAQVDNFKLSFGQSLTSLFEKLAPFISNFLVAITALPAPIKATGAVIAVLIPLVYGLVTAMGPLGLLVGGLSGAFVLVTSAIGENIKSIKEYNDTFEKAFRNSFAKDQANATTKALEDQKKVIEQLEKGTKSYEEAIKSLASSQKEATKQRQKAEENYDASIKELNKDARKRSDEDAKRLIDESRRLAIELGKRLGDEQAYQNEIEILKQKNNQAIELRKQKEKEAIDFVKGIKDHGLEEDVKRIESYKNYFQKGSQAIVDLETAKQKLIADAKEKEEQKRIATEQAIQQFVADDSFKSKQAQIEKERQHLLAQTNLTADEVVAINKAADDKIQANVDARNQNIANSSLGVLNQLNDAVQGLEEVLTQSAKDELDRINKISDERKKQIEADYNNGKISSDQKKALLDENDAYVKESGKKARKEAHDAAILARDLNIAMTIANTISASIAAYKAMAGIEVIGPILGASAAAATAIAGAVAVAKISQTPIPEYAIGTDFHQGGQAIVGERGAEIVNLPRGSQVLTAGQSAPILANRGLSGSNIVNNSSTSETNNSKVFNIQVSADDPIEMINKIKRQYGAGVFA